MIREIILSIPNHKHHLCPLATAFLSGILLYSRAGTVWPALVLIAGGGATVVLMFIKKKKEAAISIGLAAVLFFLAFFRCMYHAQIYENNQARIPTGTECYVTGKLYKKEIKTNTYLYYLKNTSYGRIMVYTQEDSVGIGSWVMVYGEIEDFPSARNEGNFDQAEYYRTMNIVCRMFADSVECQKEKRWDVREQLFRLQSKLSAVYEKELNTRDAGVLCTLVLGNKSLLETEIRQMYQDAGISHILAISGLHISILGFGLFRMLRKLKCSYWFSAGIGSGVVFGFAWMSGMAVSAKRALVMYLLMMGAQVLGRVYDGVNALALAVIIILVIQPLALFQSGFQFSCVSLVGIQFSVALLGGWEQKLSEKSNERIKNQKHDAKHKILKKIRNEMASLRKNLVSGVILQMFLLPLTAWHYYEVPMYSIFLNLLVLPLCSWLLGFGLLGGLTGLVFPEISKWLLIVCHFILSFYEKLIGTANLLPFAQIITGKPNAWVMLLYYMFLVGFCLMVLAGMNRQNRCWQDEFQKGSVSMKQKNLFAKGLWFWPCAYITNQNEQNQRKSGIVSVGLEGITFVSAAALLGSMLFVPSVETMRIDFLDVSQGDGIYLADGAGHHVMIDGGSTDENEVGRYRIEPFLKYHGVKKIDAWIITHTDSDHCSGALELLESGYLIDYLVLAEAMPDDDSRQSLIDAANQNGTEVVWADAGDALALSGCEMTCLYPSMELDGVTNEEQIHLADQSNEKTAEEEQKKQFLQEDETEVFVESDVDVNALSQVWLFEDAELSVLFTGDIGVETEKLLLDRENLKECTVLKVAHHGSKNSSSEDFLEMISPKYAVISSGEGNSYGHPHAETLERLSQIGSEIFQTQEYGQITFWKNQNEWLIRRFLD